MLSLLPSHGRIRWRNFNASAAVRSPWAYLLPISLNGALRLPLISSCTICLIAVRFKIYSFCVYAPSAFANLFNAFTTCFTFLELIIRINIALKSSSAAHDISSFERISIAISSASTISTGY